jgi:hypothetical protein
LVFNAVKEVETQTQTTCHSPSSLCQSDEEAQFLWLKHRESTVGAVVPGMKEGNVHLWHSAFWSLSDVCISESLEEASCRELIDSSCAMTYQNDTNNKTS